MTTAFIITVLFFAVSLYCLRKTGSLKASGHFNFIKPNCWQKRQQRERMELIQRIGSVSFMCAWLGVVCIWIGLIVEWVK